MTYLIVFENGQQVNSYDLSYITLLTWERMYNSKIATVNGHSVNR